MSAFGGKADINQPLLTNLDLWVHGLVRTLHVAVLYGVLKRLAREHDVYHLQHPSDHAGRRIVGTRQHVAVHVQSHTCLAVT